MFEKASRKLGSVVLWGGVGKEHRSEQLQCRGIFPAHGAKAKCSPNINSSSSQKSKDPAVPPPIAYRCKVLKRLA